MLKDFFKLCPYEQPPVMMRSLHLVYKGCLTVVLILFVATVLSSRYNLKFRHLRPPIPGKLINFSGSSTSYVNRYNYSLQAIREYSPPSIRYTMNEDHAPILSLFKECVNKQVFIKRTEAGYDLAHTSNDRNLDYTAMGFLIAYAYEKGLFLDIDFSADFLYAVFTPVLTMANDLSDSDRLALYWSLPRTDRTPDSVWFDQESKLFVYPRPNHATVGFTIFDSFREVVFKFKYGNSGVRYEQLNKGRMLLYLDSAVSNAKQHSQLIRNIHDRICRSESLSLANWWYYGINFDQRVSSFKPSVYKCLNTFKQNELQHLFAKSTGLMQMPFGGASRLKAVYVSTYASNFNQYAFQAGLWTLSQESFDCARFKEAALE